MQLAINILLAYYILYIHLKGNISNLLRKLYYLQSLKVK
jgi:hypothetical protein